MLTDESSNWTYTRHSMYGQHKGCHVLLGHQTSMWTHQTHRTTDDASPTTMAHLPSTVINTNITDNASKYSWSKAPMTNYEALSVETSLKDTQHSYSQPTTYIHSVKCFITLKQWTSLCDSKHQDSNTRMPSCRWQTSATRKHAKQKSPAIADKPARRESLPKIASIRRAYNVVADNTGLSSFV